MGLKDLPGPPEIKGVTPPTLSQLTCSTVLAGAMLAAAALPAGAAVPGAQRRGVGAPATRTVAGIPSTRIVAGIPSTRTVVEAKTVTHRHASQHRAAHRSVTHHLHAHDKVVHRKPVHKAPAIVRANLSTFESALLADINNARHAAGVGSLVAAPGTTDVARHWTLTLVRNAALSHNPRLATDVQGAGSNSWTWIGENVGTGPANDEADLFAAYMASPHHRDNILDPRGRYVGIGVVQTTDANGNQVAYNTCDFTDAYSSAYGADKTPALPAVVSVSSAAAALAD